jgi:hypothetical protein
VPIVSTRTGKEVTKMRHRCGGRSLSRLAVAMAAAAVSCGAAAVAGSLGCGVAVAAAARAHEARRFSLNETGNLRMTSKHEFTLNERGAASGTITGVIYVHLTVVSTSRVTAEVNIYPRGGSITGYAVRQPRSQVWPRSAAGRVSTPTPTGPV